MRTRANGWIGAAVLGPLLAGSVAAGVSVRSAEAAGGCPATPAEITGVAIGPNAEDLSWVNDPCATDYNVYRGLISHLRSGHPAKCHGGEIAGAAFQSPGLPELGEAYFYLVTAEATEEGTPGFANGVERALLGSCDAVVRKHVLDRTGYGWSEWTRDRIEVLGIQAYLDEQLDPATVDESTNLELTTRTADLDPPQTIQELIGLDIVTAVYGRRQLEQQVALFWANHFNTDYAKSFMHFNFLNPDADRKRLEAITLHHRELEQFRDIAFDGTFRDISGASAYSPAMIIYLDTKNNKVGRPNENYARELLELHTMGVDGGYTDQDIVELARVFTGWDVCKKITADVADPLAPCIGTDLIGGPEEPEGLFVARFRANNHACGEKILFEGTAQEATIPETCDSPSDGVNDAALALDAIVAHPSTPEFISRKLLERFVSEQPTQVMLDNVVAVWNDPGNPHGVGDLREVLRAVLSQGAFLSPDSIGEKIKTPFEHIVSVLRSIRGKTNGTSQVRNYLDRMQHLPHLNPVPTGYAEVGSAWIDSNNVLERQNFGADVAPRTGNNFGGDVIGLLQDNGISTAAGNAEAIVDFFGGVLFGGALAPGDRQSAIAFLESDDSGNPDPGYNNARIRQTVGFMLGFAQFQEQ